MAADAQAHAAKLVPGFTPVKRIGSMSCQRVQDHYARSGTGRGIAARIIQALRATTGADVAITPETLAPFDHVHGCGVLATQDLVVRLEPRAGETILDIGAAAAAAVRRDGSRRSMIAP